VAQLRLRRGGPGCLLFVDKKSAEDGQARIGLRRQSCQKGGDEAAGSANGGSAVVSGRDGRRLTKRKKVKKALQSWAGGGGSFKGNGGSCSRKEMEFYR